MARLLRALARHSRRLSDWLMDQSYAAWRRERRRTGMAGRVVSTPGVCGGDRRLDGTRIPIACLRGLSREYVAEGWPYLTDEDWQACQR